MLNLNGIDEMMIKHLIKSYSKEELARRIVTLNNEIMMLQSMNTNLFYLLSKGDDIKTRGC